MTKSQESMKRTRALLGVQFLSDFGDQITAALLAISILEITNSTSKVSLVYFSTIFGYVVFTLIGGFLGDKINKRNILMYSDLGRGFFSLLLIVALYKKSIEMIYVLSFFHSMLGSLYRPVKLGIWTHSIPSSKLESYNSLSELSIHLSTIIGPLIAAFFASSMLVGLGFAVDAMTFFICALIFGVLFSHFSTENSASAPKKVSFLSGFKIIAQKAEIWKMIAYDAIQMLGFGAFNASFLILAQRDFGWSKAQYTTHLSIIAFFSVIGASLASTRFVVQLNQTMKLIVGSFVSALALVALLKFGTFPLSSILFGICDGLAVFTMAVTRTRVQLAAKKDHPEHVTSIIAARSIIIKAATLIGAGTCVLVGDYFNLRSTLLWFTLPIGISFLPVIMKSRKAESCEVSAIAFKEAAQV